jgi:ribonuclease HI
MEQDSFYYVVLDRQSRPKIAHGKSELIDIIHDFTNPKIRTYTKREEAQSYLDSYEDMQTINVSKKPEKVPSPTEGTKKLKTPKESSEPRKNSLLKANEDLVFGSKNEEKRTEDTSNEEYDPLNLDNIKVPPNSRNASTVEEKRERKSTFEKKEKNFLLDEKKENKPAPMSLMSPIFEYFRENAKDQALAKYKIRPNEPYIMQFDGASKANPGNSGAGYVILNAKREKVYSNYMNLGIKTNNQAEYSGMIYGLKSAQNLGIKNLEVAGDSQLIIYQMTGKYQVKNEALKPYHKEAKLLEAGFEKISFNWIPREQNSEADALSNQGVMARF